MTTEEKINKYIESKSQWSENLALLRSLLNNTELTEEVKWGAPAYTYEGKILIGLLGFKHHMGLWFHQGVHLSDPYQVLENAQEGKTKYLRHWKFKKGDLLETKKIKEYIDETIQIAKNN